MPFPAPGVSGVRGPGDDARESAAYAPPGASASWKRGALGGARGGPRPGGGASSKPASRSASRSAPPSGVPPPASVSCGYSPVGGGGNAALFSLYPPIWPPHASSSALASDVVSEPSYWLLRVLPGPSSSPAPPYPPAAGCARSSSRRRRSARRCLRRRERSQSSHRRSGMFEPSKTPVPSPCPSSLASPATFLHARRQHPHTYLNTRTDLVSPQEKSSKCQNAYVGRTKFQIGRLKR
jgi:hypothetical protein